MSSPTRSLRSRRVNRYAGVSAIAETPASLPCRSSRRATSVPANAHNGRTGFMEVVNVGSTLPSGCVLTRVTWLLCDYGEVLSQAPPIHARTALVAASGCNEAEFWSAYWKHRAAYDRGDVTSEDYWCSVTAAPVSPGKLEHLIELDIFAWLHKSSPALAAASRAAQRGYKLAILSNAPREIADALRRASWLEGFSPRLFSCDLREVKPDVAVFTKAVATLGIDDPSRIEFFDDRPENVAGAAAAGLRAHRFVSASQIDDLPPA